MQRLVAVEGEERSKLSVVWQSRSSLGDLTMCVRKASGLFVMYVLNGWMTRLGMWFGLAILFAFSKALLLLLALFTNSASILKMSVKPLN